MELKDRKYINNVHPQLPHYEDGLTFAQQKIAGYPASYRTRDAQIAPISISDFAIGQMKDRMRQAPLNMNPVDVPVYEKPKKEAQSSFEDAAGGILQTGIGFARSINDAFNTDMTVNKYLADAGTSEGSIGGIKYKRINPIYKDGKLPKYEDGFSTMLGTAGNGAAFGASIGSIIPGLGTGFGALAGGALGAITGLFGSASRKRQEEKMKAEANRMRLAANNFGVDSAMSTYLQQKEAEDLSAPTYRDGKQPLLDSAFGMINGTPNAKVDKGEWMINTITGAAHKVTRGAGDNALAYVRPEDTILSKKRGAADYFEQTGDLIGAMSMNKKQYKDGKMPAFKEGFLPNAIISGLGGLVGLGQYLGARNQDVKTPNTYISNLYETRALAGLAGLQYNPYPILGQLRDRQAYLNYALNNSGGLSGSQKYLGRIANANNMYRATADLLTGLQERNIGLGSNYFNTMANLGAQQAQRKQATTQYDLDYYSKAHAGQQARMNTGLYNILSNAQNWYTNDFRRRQFNDTTAMFKDDQKREWKKLKAQFPNLG